MSSESPDTNAERLRIPRTIWALGFVSLFMDLSSELLHSLLVAEGPQIYEALIARA
jgi:hypothetical protein